MRKVPDCAFGWILSHDALWEYLVGKEVVSVSYFCVARRKIRRAARVSNTLLGHYGQRCSPQVASIRVGAKSGTMSSPVLKGCSWKSPICLSNSVSAPMG
jgi:hypothetical protein